MSEKPEELELTALAAALRELQPRPETLDRAALMYRAGRASARGWAWPATAVGSTVVALALALVLWLRPAPPVIERIVYLPAPPPEPASTSPAESAPPLVEDTGGGGWSQYVHLQEQVLRDGLDGLPPPPEDVPPAPNIDRLFPSF